MAVAVVVALALSVAGLWANDVMSGHGVLEYKSGTRYEGEWANNQKHGRGVLRHASGTTYDGEFRHDKKCGHGRYTFPNGDEYEGTPPVAVAHTPWRRAGAGQWRRRRRRMAHGRLR